MQRAILTLMAVVLPLCGGESANALQTQEPIVVGTRASLESAALGEQRQLWIGTPPGYDSSAQARFPVLYLLDGDVHFHHAYGLVRYLSYYLQAPQMIVVGVLNTNRTRDFTPPPFSGEANSASAGRADRFSRFLIEEVKGYINREYRTEDFSILVGHSLAGLFTVYSLATSPTAFDAYIAISPSLYWDDAATVNVAQSTIKQGTDRLGFLYLALGESERSAIITSTRSLAAGLEADPPQRFVWKLDEFPGEGHLTVPYPALHAGLRWLFDGWSLPFESVTAQIASDGDISPFLDHYRGLTARYGFDVQPTERIISMVGDRLYRSGDFEEAIGLFTRRIELYPNSPAAHDELGRGFEAAGRDSLALASYERAYALATAQRDPALEAIRQRLERVRGRH